MKKIVSLFFGVLLAVFLWVLMFGGLANSPGSSFNKAHNAIWLGHEWVGEVKSEGDVEELVRNLEKHGIDTVFVHSGPFLSDGSVDANVYPLAFDFLKKARKFSSEIQWQAWLGQIRGKIDIDDEKVRGKMVKTVGYMVTIAGFDGIHFDVEPVWDEDEGFFMLLEESRREVGKEVKISVALAEFVPGSVIWLLEGLYEFVNVNSEVTYERVKEQTIWVSDLMEGTEVFMGIPAYESESPAENVKNALEGIVEGLNHFRSEEDNFAGVSIYAYWEMEDEEWAVWRDVWGL
ncbi:hypothetical protein JKY72_05525 [Candidatus Gracilibacteria bacterium]|nr:hypothetical protein [Candidatus Gracilibacteria bacterium]